ncbi:MAG TPA: TerB family tellurite resistance protein [Pseudobacteroides sp.]|uniref:tellurite resistance TerB family protein n=1 Tax=Pseudobacteroides sp. TaxID=1968840 RepID=UPI002F91C4B2
MGFLDWAKQKGASLTGEVKKIANKDFMEAVAAACALVASADGNISSEEKQKMIGFININDTLKVFKINDVIDRFNHYASHFDFDYNVGKIEAMKQVEKMKNKPSEARLLIAVCVSVGSSDGNFDKSEVAIVKEMCQRLSLDPKEFGI